MNIISGIVCTNINCQHTHVYGGIQYLDCPYCKCHTHSSDEVTTLTIYNVKRFKAFVRKHKQPRVKVDNEIDSEIEQMIQSIQLV